MKGAGFAVESASDGQEALVKNRLFHPDFLIMDIRMPRLNGEDTCLAVQRERPEVPVILMTGFSDAVDEANAGIFARACQGGQVRIMLKPLDLDRVIRIVRNGQAQDELVPAFPTPFL
jgi:DNA-binding NtrC family response regulator